jgi:opacity protein-like surface antigen
MKRLLILAVLAIALIGMAGAANYMYEKASVKGVGYKNVEMIISTQTGFNSTKLVEKESGSGNVVTEKTELEAERQIGSQCGLGIDWPPYDKFFE